MAKITNTLLDDIDIGFAEIFNKIEKYRVKLEGSLSQYETDKYVECLIKSQRMLKRVSAEVNDSLDVLIDQYY